jgi:membrane-bound lytic murein transglycosylase B
LRSALVVLLGDPGIGSYLALFEQADRKYGIPWPVLAGIGEVESGDGVNDGPSSVGIGSAAIILL